MSDVFAPPKANLETRVGPTILWEMELKQLRKLYNASRTIRTIGVLWGIGATLVGLGTIAALFAVVAGPTQRSAWWVIPLLVASAALSIAGTWTAFTRPGWGRPLGFVLNALSLINIPFGTIIGLFGLVAYGQGAILFGPDKVLHKDLVDVYKRRKSAK